MIQLDPINNAYDIRVTGEKDAAGNPVPLPSVAFKFSLSDDTLGIFTANADGLSGTFVGAKDGSGTVFIVDQVVGATARSEFTFTTPVPPPPVAATIDFTESSPHPAV